MDVHPRPTMSYSHPNGVQGAKAVPPKCTTRNCIALPPGQRTASSITVTLRPHPHCRSISEHAQLEPSRPSFHHVYLFAGFFITALALAFAAGLALAVAFVAGFAGAFAAAADGLF